MSLTTMVEDLDLPGGADPRGVTVEIFPAGEQGARIPAVYHVDPDAADDVTIVGTRVLTVRNGGLTEAGKLEIDLPPQSECDPAGAVWGITVTGRDFLPSTRFFFVPDAEGPHSIYECLTDPPGALPSPGVQALIDALDARLSHLEQVAVIDPEV